jgi:hypothetical protein
MRVKLKGINTVRHQAADGSVSIYYYHRGIGKRLRGEPASPEFIISFEEAGRAFVQKRGAGTVSSLIRQYCESR